RTAFSRAWEILDNHRAAKWTALTAAVLAALLTVGLLGVLALYVDLLISKGAIPAHHELAEVQRQAFRDALPGLTGARRADALEAVGAPPDRAKEFEKDFGALSRDDQERLWRAFVWHHLDSTVSPAAAAAYAAQARATELHSSVPGMGLLSLVV